MLRFTVLSQGFLSFVSGGDCALERLPRFHGNHSHPEHPYTPGASRCV